MDEVSYCPLSDVKMDNIQLHKSHLGHQVESHVLCPPCASGRPFGLHRRSISGRKVDRLSSEYESALEPIKVQSKKLISVLRAIENSITFLTGWARPPSEFSKDVVVRPNETRGGEKLPVFSRLTLARGAAARFVNETK